MLQGIASSDAKPPHYGGSGLRSKYLASPSLIIFNFVIVYFLIFNVNRKWQLLIPVDWFFFFINFEYKECGFLQFLILKIRVGSGILKIVAGSISGIKSFRIRNADVNEGPQVKNLAAWSLYRYFTRDA